IRSGTGIPACVAELPLIGITGWKACATIEQRVIGSARPIDADLWAGRLDWTSGAPRRRRLAYGLPEGDEQAVVPDPVAAWQNGSQRGFCLLGRRGLHQAPSIRDPMHMRIDADAGLAERLGHDQVRGLAPDATQRQ